MEGPIPSTISLLKNLTELIIADLDGSASTFPNLQEMRSMQRLILRNCLLVGEIQDYIQDMTNLKILDLSFNMLTGQIPDSFESLENLKYMFLTNNSLTGVIPAWIMNNKRNMDISYNNFTGSVQFGCQQSSVNLVSSLSSSDNSISWCLRKDLPCFGKAQCKHRKVLQVLFNGKTGIN
uniref:LRR-RLK n=1 Tax=Rhizophora mucronata TaxID=61149 RepID=A0A2P2MVK3_RHIMU